MGHCEYVFRFGKPQKSLVKASLGAEKSVPWLHSKSTSQLIEKLRQEGYEIVSLEQSTSSIVYTKYRPKKCALIVGNEVDGVSKKTLMHSDVVIEIPMKGIKESLNVSVATGIALFQMMK